MDPFEEDLRNLPWRKPSKELRERLFADSDEETTIIQGSLGRWASLGWAAAVTISMGLLVRVLWPADSEIANAVPPVIHEDVPTLEIASRHTFFDFTTGIDDTWAGSLTLKIESN